MTRADVRTGIATFFGGTSYDPQYKVWRPTPLQSVGLAAVRAWFPKRMSDDDFTAGLTVGRAMGAVMVVHLPSDTESREGMGGPVAGIKRDRYAVELHLYHYGQTAHSEDAQADFEQLLEAIVARIHGDRTLGGTVTQAGETAAGIVRQMDPPTIDPPERTESYGVIRFEADTYTIA